MLRSSSLTPGALLLFLVVLSSNIHEYYCKKGKRSMIGVESWKLVKVEPVEVQSLADLTDGVFALRISGGRSSVCGLGSGGMLCCAVRSRDIQWQFHNLSAHTVGADYIE